jgi:hypothetical protein
MISKEPAQLPVPCNAAQALDVLPHVRDYSKCESPGEVVDEIIRRREIHFFMSGILLKYKVKFEKEVP